MKGGGGCGRSDADAYANADDEGEATKGGDVGKEKELIVRCGYDMVDAAGGRGRVGREGEGGGYKAPTEDRGGTPEGRGEGQSLRAVVGRARPSVFFDSATYAKRGGEGAAQIRGQRAAGLRRIL